jgi:exosome complex component CSL4
MDVVRAQVLSLGDSRSYYLSTAKNELGVVLAKSISGEALVPISWEQMQCPSTLKKEYRKVAKFVNSEGQGGVDDDKGRDNKRMF